jgi:hypothetical protein
LATRALLTQGVNHWQGDDGITNGIVPKNQHTPYSLRVDGRSTLGSTEQESNNRRKECSRVRHGRPWMT